VKECEDSVFPQINLTGAFLMGQPGGFMKTYQLAVGLPYGT